jgi:hypothetical protein
MAEKKQVTYNFTVYTFFYLLQVKNDEKINENRLRYSQNLDFFEIFSVLK